MEFKNHESTLNTISECEKKNESIKKNINLNFINKFLEEDITTSKQKTTDKLQNTTLQLNKNFIQSLLKNLFLIFDTQSSNKKELILILENNFMDLIQKSDEIRNKLIEIVYNYIINIDG